MAEVKWIKVVVDIFDDEKILLIESLPDADSIIVCWFKLLCLAGKQNNSGVLMLNDRIPYTDEMLATIFRRPLQTVRLALNTFERFGMVEIINGAVAIPNWAKHQKLDDIEKIREQTRARVSKYREKQKLLAEGNATQTLQVTQCNSTDIETDIRDQISEKREQSIEPEKEDLTVSDETVCRPQDVRRVVESWNSLGLQNIRRVPSADSKTGQMLRARIREYGVKAVLEAVEKVRNSDFLMGKVNDFQATLDWFSRPNNFPKVINGNYDKHEQGQPQTQQAKDLNAKYNMMKDWADKHESE